MAEEFDGGGCAANFACGYGSTELGNFEADVHHGGAAFGIEMRKPLHQGMVGRTSHGERASCPAGTRRSAFVLAKQERSEESFQGRGWAVREPCEDWR